MKPGFRFNSVRAKKARLAHKLRIVDNRLGFIAISLLSMGAVIGIFFSDMPRLGYLAATFASAIFTLVLWNHYDLRNINPITPMQQLDDIIEPKLLALLKSPLTPHSLWDAAKDRPEGIFMLNHLFINDETIEQLLPDDEAHLALVWNQALTIMQAGNQPELHAGAIITAILISSDEIERYLIANKLKDQDVCDVLAWLERQMAYIKQAPPYFGGIGRDWASGFTPTLEHFGRNLSQIVEARHGYAHFLAHDDVMVGIAHTLNQGSGVAIVGEEGAGKTTLAYGLAQRLLEGREPELQYYQIVALDAAMILSYSGAQLERLMLTLFAEAIAAGNIILFLDDAELFFNSGVGSFDMSQILLPTLKNRNLKIIAAFNPSDWQELQGKHSALASSFVNVTLTEPPEAATYKIVEDIVLSMETRNRTLVTFSAIREAYRLSGQYLQDQAYPGKVLTLLEQSMPYATDQIVSSETVQTALEKTKGVRVSSVKAPEADMLLNLEDKIHERMIDQERAVSVVASALRRGRAGVSNPKRPLGSFLFLGPTGVGKTELARSLAAVYFGSEQNMVRLDMSEYQRPSDVSRLLSTGSSSEKSLLITIREQPFSVVLLDEIEKAHPNVLNLLLQMLDEGQLTDDKGRAASFRNAIVITTSNAGAADITKQVKTKGTLEGFERPLIDTLIAKGQFKPELINRYDEVVLFGPLGESELGQVAKVMLREVNKTLVPQQISVELTPTALKKIIHEGYDPQFGARPMRRIIQKTVENAVAERILRGQAQAGSKILLDVDDLAPTTPKAKA